MGTLTVGAIIPRRERVVTVRQDDSVETAVQTMRACNVGSLIVVEKSGTIVGIVTEHDIVTQWTELASDPLNTAVAQIMTGNPAACILDTPVEEASRMMVAGHIRHLPVVKDGRPIGMVSSRDIMRHQRDLATATTAAAEQTAQLIKCLRTLELDEVSRMIDSEVPRMFQASRHALCQPEGSESEGKTPVLRRQECLCPEQELIAWARSPQWASQQSILDKVPPTCKAEGCAGTRITIPLACGDSADARDGEPNRARPFLCMCGLPPETKLSGGALQYKSTLVQDILNATLANARLYEEAHRRSLTDPLTGLKTRTVLDVKLVEERERGVRYGSPFSVAILDVDKFKHVNDTYGHDAGDQVLRGLAEVLRTQVRATDVTVRYGGDEFVVFMPGTQIEQAAETLERVRCCVEQSVSTPRTDLR